MWFFFMNKLIKNWLPLLVWAGLIFFLSHQPDLKSGLLTTWDFVLRKLVHILVYAILTFLLIRALKEHRLEKRRVFVLAIIFAIFYAFSDEYHQSFIPGREASLRDVAIDSLGVFLAAWLTKRKMVK
jgi:VanZ family protein